MKLHLTYLIVILSDVLTQSSTTISVNHRVMNHDSGQHNINSFLIFKLSTLSKRIAYLDSVIFQLYYLIIVGDSVSYVIVC